MPAGGKMRDEEDDNHYRIVMPVPLWLRIFFLAVALFVIVVPVWELHRGVWPLNWFSLFFLVIIGGAWSIGFPVGFTAIAGWAEAWTVRPGRIHVVRRNPFGFRRYSFGPTELAPFEITERESMEGSNTWFVTLVTSSGERFKTYDVQSRAAAERMRERINRVFNG